jgi:hypothetical protein
LFSLDNTIETNTTPASGSYVFLFGSYTGSDTQSKAMARFVWEDANHENIFAEFPIEKVRFIIDSTVTRPYCTFSFRESSFFDQNNWWETVNYVIFTIRKENIKNKDIMLDMKPKQG